MNRYETADIVVIGGGAIGAAAAACLALDGADVTLVERGEYAWGSSRRCDGHAVTYDSPPGYFSRFCKMGLDMFPEFVPLLPCDIGFTPEGLGLLVDNERDMDTVRATYEGKKKEGMHVVLWEQEELRKHEPNIADHIIASLNFMGDAKLNPMKLAFGLAHLAGQRGAKLFNRTQVTSIDVREGKVTRIETDKGVISANKVVIAAGVWTPELAAMTGVNIPIRPRQGQILVTEKVRNLVGKNYAEYGYLAAKGGIPRTGVTSDMEKYGVAFVVEPSSSGTVLVGSSRRFVEWDSYPNPAVMQTIAQRATHFFPKFSQTRIIRAYAGLRPASPDGKPIISPTHIKGLYVASGHEGNGIGLSLITGRLVSQMLRGVTPDIEMEPLHLDRFKLNPPALPVC